MNGGGKKMEEEYKGRLLVILRVVRFFLLQIVADDGSSGDNKYMASGLLKQMTNDLSQCLQRKDQNIMGGIWFRNLIHLFCRLDAPKNQLNTGETHWSKMNLDKDKVDYSSCFMQTIIIA
ncbi:hypothetical protein ACJX0J_013699, partial [Zea mays]